MVVRLDPRLPGRADRQHDDPAHVAQLGEETVERLLADRSVGAEVDDDGVAEATLGAQGLDVGDLVHHLPADLGVDRDALGRQVLGRAEHHRVADGEDRVRLRRHGRGRASRRRRGGGRSHGGRRRVRPSPRPPARWCRASQSPAARSPGSSSGVVVGAARSSTLVTASLPSSSDWAISFGLSSAVARLATANTDTATQPAPAAAMIRRGTGRAAPAAAATSARRGARRIGISMKRYDASATTAVSASASTNSATVSAPPGHPADDLVDRPVEEVDPVRPDADPQQHRVAENAAGPRPAVGDAGDQHQRGEPGEEEPTAEQPRIGALGRDDVEVPAQGRQPGQPDEGDDVDEMALAGAAARA